MMNREQQQSVRIACAMPNYRTSLEAKCAMENAVPVEETSLGYEAHLRKTVYACGNGGPCEYHALVDGMCIPAAALHALNRAKPY
jgi:hypothetical protein